MKLLFMLGGKTATRVKVKGEKVQIKKRVWIKREVKEGLVYEGRKK